MLMSHGLTAVISGFVPNAQLVFKAVCIMGDYHGQMNSANFEKWVVEN
jgi:hypothetical protein